MIGCRKATASETENDMKKASTTAKRTENDSMRAEYDFTGGVRGKHYRAMQAGYTVHNSSSRWRHGHSGSGTRKKGRSL